MERMGIRAVVTGVMVIAISITTFFGVRLNAEDWPCFRGPTRQGVSSEKGLPLRWSGTSNVKWKTAIPGEGFSSPIVSGDRLFVTSTTDGDESCRVVSLDRKSGKVLWDREVFRQTLTNKERRNSYATPTPVTDGKVVFAAFGGGGFAAVDFDGEVVWTNHDFPFHSKHGLGASLLLHEDLLIMPRDASSKGPDIKVGWQIPWDKSFVLALDKKTGDLRWKGKEGTVSHRPRHSRRSGKHPTGSLRSSAAPAMSFKVSTSPQAISFGRQKILAKELSRRWYSAMVSSSLLPAGAGARPSRRFA